MNPSTNSVWLHRFAWLIASLTLLLPVTTGAVVTTLKAGMVFADWPSSDGHFMLAYPWLGAARDEFVEHGHRLSGMTIGLLSLSLAIAAWFLGRRPFVRFLAIGIFIAVFAQGLLGGARVLLSEQFLALLHGDFAAAVFSLMAILVLFTSSGWPDRKRLSSVEESQSNINLASMLLATLVAQYLMGGFLRHLRERQEFAWAWMIHPWFALVVLFSTFLFVFAVYRSESPHLRRCGMALISLTVAQSLVGLMTWYVRYGVPEWGVIAQQDSWQQITVCSLHKVVGMLTLMTSVLTVVCCWSVRPLRDAEPSSVSVGKTVAGVAV
jgi:cytochrome c oxidase assembly protein subunit 15